MTKRTAHRSQKERRRAIAERVRLCRRRKRRGRCVLTIELDPGAVGDLLVENRFLGQWDLQDRAKLRAALEHALDFWAEA